jgi:hypothetical protein
LKPPCSVPNEMVFRWAWPKYEHRLLELSEGQGVVALREYSIGGERGKRF